MQGEQQPCNLHLIASFLDIIRNIPSYMYVESLYDTCSSLVLKSRLIHGPKVTKRANMDSILVMLLGSGTQMLQVFGIRWLSIR